MINHGSNIILCLKSVSNQLKSYAPIVLKRNLVSVQVKVPQKHLLKSRISHEFYSTNVTPATSVIEASCKHVSGRQTKNLPMKPTCAQLASKHSSYQTQLYNCDSILSSRNTPSASHPLRNHVGIQLESSLGVPCSGTLDDIVLVNLSEQCKTDRPVVVYTSEHTPLLFCDLERQMMLLSQLSDDGSEGFVVKKEYSSGNAADPPTSEQIEKVHRILSNDLPKFFVKPLNYTIYHPALIFENNLQGKQTKGLYNYVKQAAYLRTVGHIRFIYVKYEVMKITGHPEDGTVKVRWRINVIKFRKMLKIWQWKIWDWSTFWDKMEVWYDGFSTYYVGGDGLVHKHVADRMIPDQDPLLDKKVQKTASATEPLLCEKTSSFNILPKPSKNPSEPLQLNGL